MNICHSHRSKVRTYLILSPGSVGGLYPADPVPHSPLRSPSVFASLNLTAGSCFSGGCTRVTGFPPSSRWAAASWSALTVAACAASAAAASSRALMISSTVVPWNAASRSTSLRSIASCAAKCSRSSAWVYDSSVCVSGVE